jgi:transposase
MPPPTKLDRRRIALAMSARGLNQADLARRLQYHESSLCRLLARIKESGEANAATARGLAKAIGCSLADIMPEE